MGYYNKLPFLFSPNMPFTAGLVGFWKGNNTPNDSYGSNNGTLVNGATYAAGLVGNAFSTDGIDDYVSFADNSWNFNTFSVSCWVKAPSYAAEQGLVTNMWYSGVYHGWNVLAFNNKIYFQINNVVSTNLISNNITNATWYNVIVTRLSATRSRIYINGALDVSNANATEPSYAFSTKSVFGTEQNNTAGFYNGLIQYVRVYNTELSSTDVTNLYNGGTPI